MSVGDYNAQSIIVPEAPHPDDMPGVLKAEVRKLFDGDGFLAKVWHPVRETWVDRVPCRFAFIDAPEMQQPFGAEAKAFLEQLIAKRVLQLAPILKESAGYLPIDSYKRMLCMGYLTEEMPVGEIQYFRDGRCETGIVKRARLVTRNIELEMIVNGWAWVTRQYAFDHEESYFAAEADACSQRRGLWAIDNPEPPWRFKQREKRRRLAAERQPSLFPR